MATHPMYTIAIGEMVYRKNSIMKARTRTIKRETKDMAPVVGNEHAEGRENTWLVTFEFMGRFFDATDIWDRISDETASELFVYPLHPGIKKLDDYTRNMFREAALDFKKSHDMEVVLNQRFKNYLDWFNFWIYYAQGRYQKSAGIAIESSKYVAGR